jgi:excisionase family DNA binding protein
MSTDHSLLTARQIAALLQCSVRQIWRLSEAGILPARRKIGRVVRWRRAEIERWIEAGCPANTRRKR